MKLIKKIGISLIVLVVTVITMIILLTVVVVNVSKNSPVLEANKSVFINDIVVFKTELELYKTKQSRENLGKYEGTILQADETSITYDDIIDNTKTINDIITSLSDSEKYLRSF